MDGGHESLLNAEAVIHNFSDGSEAVGRARSVGYNLIFRFVGTVVNSIDEDWSLVLWGSGKNRFLGTSLNVQRALFFV
jgi:hypothetical protein